MAWEALQGKFVVIDGPDGAGKSTQVKLMREFLEGAAVGVVSVRDPGGTPIGEQIRQILLSNANAQMRVACEVLLYMASRAQLWAECIEPALQGGQCVISDRWISSTIAYQAVAGKIGAPKVLQIAEAALERPWPDVTLVLDLPSDVGMARVGAETDRMEGKGAGFHQQVREAFLTLADGRLDFRVIDGQGSVAEVHHRLREALGNYVDS